MWSGKDEALASVNRGSKLKSSEFTILVLFLVGAFVASIAASDLSSEIGDEANQTTNQISVWYRTPFGKFNVEPIPPLHESSQRDSADPERRIWIYDGPHPFSSFRRAIVVERETDFTVLLFDSAGVAADSLIYAGMEPGWYGLLFGTTDEVESIRIRSGELIVGEWRENP